MHRDVQDAEFYSGVRGIAETVITEWPEYRQFLDRSTVERHWYELASLDQGEAEDSASDFRECSERVEVYSGLDDAPVAAEIERVPGVFHQRQAVAVLHTGRR
ncbi:hypothetical protein HN371_20870 [Candidatus Poribacteria bacterium]|jgi:hypothetical protein|nr:hypothetical protein [Candidatus Poribacteria bacterium]MBT5536597.1 hypothetical protein [Candidatus Poribacteria bacterium]MBT5710461.1 hypothetical protein [Candidatus Poribacteria bacterium]MBT7808635.1 hypothetical protein [Candidatus Poribacteria bacterium]